MAESYASRIHTEHVVLDIGPGLGALVLYTPQELCGREIEVSRKGNDATRMHTAIHERRIQGRTVFAGVFAALPAGRYDIWGDGPHPTAEVTIVGGEVAEVHCSA